MRRAGERRTSRSKLSTMIDRDVFEDLNDIAEEEGRTFQEVVSDACELYVKKSCGPSLFQNPLGWASNTLGKAFYKHPLKSMVVTGMAFIYIQKKGEQASEAEFQRIIDQVEPLFTIMLAAISPISGLLRELTNMAIPKVTWAGSVMQYMHLS